MAKPPIMDRRERPRDPLELRKSLPELLSAPKNRKSSPARIQTERDTHVDAPGARAPATVLHPTTANDLTANPACFSDFEPFPDTTVGRLPRGPDYGALNDVIEGLVDQSRRFRLQWRERHNKDQDRDLATPLIVASEDTVELYVSRGFRLRDQYIRTMASSMSVEDIDPIAFVDWALALRPLLDEDTWRFYRAGAERLIQTLPSADMEEALGWLYSDLHIGDDRRTGRGEKRRANRLDQAHLEKLKLELGMKRSKTARRLEAWLDAGVKTGVHPTQWPLCSLEILPDAQAPRGKRIWLHVVAGHIESRWLAHRSMDISTFEDSTLGAIEQMIKNAREWARKGQLAARQGEVNHLLRKTSKELFPRQRLHYDLHTARDQFIDNMRSIYSDAEVAALMGQELCLHRERLHYVNHRPEWTQIKERPVPSSRLVSRMKSRLAIYDRLHELQELKDEFKRLRAKDEDPPDE
jgi:hypothetical protein